MAFELAGASAARSDSEAASFVSFAADTEVALTSRDGRDEDPSWSPDGTSLVFQASHRDDNWNIYIIDIESGDVRLLFDEPSREYWPHWSPGRMD